MLGLSSQQILIAADKRSISPGFRYTCAECAELLLERFVSFCWFAGVAQQADGDTGSVGALLRQVHTLQCREGIFS